MRENMGREGSGQAACKATPPDYYVLPRPYAVAKATRHAQQATFLLFPYCLATPSGSQPHSPVTEAPQRSSQLLNGTNPLCYLHAEGEAG